MYCFRLRSKLLSASEQFIQKPNFYFQHSKYSGLKLSQPQIYVFLDCKSPLLAIPNLIRTRYSFSLLQKFNMSSTHKESNAGIPKCDIADKPSIPVELSKKDKLKQAVKDYGSTVIIFHIGISLISLGAFYLAASSGLNMENMVSSVGFDSAVTAATVGNAGTFVIAYAIHKVFAPVRISITLVSAPFIVRYLRQKGILKVKTGK